MSAHDKSERELLQEKLCAYVFGELEDTERAAFEDELAASPELSAEKERLEATIGLVRTAYTTEDASSAGNDLAQRIVAAASDRRDEDVRAREHRGGFLLLRGGPFVRAAAAVVLLFGGVVLWKELHAPPAPAATALDGVARAPELESGFRKDSDAGAARYAPPEDAYAQRQKASTLAKAEGLGESKELAFQAGEAVREQAAEVAPEVAPGDALGASLFSDASSVTASDPDRALGDLGELDFEATFEELNSLGYVAGGGDDGTDKLADGPLEVQLGLLARGEPSVAAGLEPSATPSAPSASGPSSPGLGAPGGAGGQALKSPASAGGRAVTYKGAGDTVPPASGGARFGNRHGGRVRQAEAEEEPIAEPTLEALGYGGGGPERRFVTPRQRDDKEQAQDLRGLLEAAPRRARKDGRKEVELLRDIGYVESEERDNALRDELSAARNPADAKAYLAQLDSMCGLRPNEAPRDYFFRCWGEHPFVRTADDPLSTFAADVDTASYALARRTLRAGRLPAREQVRTEEFVNYFRPDLVPPTEGRPFAVRVELAPAFDARAATLQVLRVGVRARDVDAFERQDLALTFVVDVSGSMDMPLRMPLVKKSLELLLEQLSTNDSLAIVTFANEASVALPMTSAANRSAALDVIAALEPGGGTNLEAGLLTGFEHAASQLTANAVNRVVLLSDGVGNIGETDQLSLLAGVSAQRDQGVYLNTVGVGMGDHHDAFLEQLADRGDGLFNTIDSEREARRALVENFTGAFQPVARDVKIQVEFDPAQVLSYRQLGYENRAIADRLFRDDAVDAGEINAGHQVSALYEVELASFANTAGPLATVRLRYKPAHAVDAGALDEAAREQAEVATEETLAFSAADASTWQGATPGFRRTVLVARFAEFLRRSVHVRERSVAELLAASMALAPTLADEEFDEFVQLVELAAPDLEREFEALTDDVAEATYALTRAMYRRALLQAEKVDALALTEPEDGADESPEALLEKEIERLEAELRALVRKRFGAKPEGPVVSPGKGQR